MFLVKAGEHRSRIVRGGHGCRVVLLLVMAITLAVPAAAKIVREVPPHPEPSVVFERLASAWEANDEEALAGLVHADGLRVTNLHVGERASHYSPSQAFYFFRNLFQAHRTLLFEFTMTQEATAGARIHGMATWKRRRPDSEQIQIVRLVCVLAQQDGRWQLAEINTIR